MKMKRILRGLVGGGTILAGGAAFGQTYVQHAQRLHVPRVEGDSRGLVQHFNGDELYVASVDNQPGIFPPNTRPLFVRMDPRLNLLAAVSYARPGEFMLPDPQPFNTALRVDPEDIERTEDNGAIICGSYDETTFDGIPVDAGSFLLKTDPAGNVIWYRQYPRIDQFTSVVELRLPNGPAYAVCGFQRLQSGLPSEAVILMADSFGAFLWQRNVWALKNNFRGNAAYQQVIRYGQQQVALTGFANGRGVDGIFGPVRDRDVLVSRFDLNGNPTLNLAYGQSFVQFPGGVAGVIEEGNGLSLANGPAGAPNDLVITGRWALACVQGCQGERESDILTMRIDAAGGVQWANRYDVQQQPDQGVAVQVRDQRILVQADAVTNYRDANGLFNPDMALLFLTPNGVPFAPTDIFGGDGVDRAEDFVLPTVPGDTTAILLGTSKSFNAPFPVPWLVERFNAVCTPCEDTPVDVPTIEIPMPLLQPTVVGFETPAILRELRAHDVELLEEIICKRCLIGDLNGDGVISVSDIAAFVLALTNPAAYPGAYPDGCLESADVNCDGVVSVSDIGPFVALVTAP